MTFRQPANITDRVFQNLAFHGGTTAPFAVIVAGLLFAVRRRPGFGIRAFLRLRLAGGRIAFRFRATRQAAHLDRRRRAQVGRRGHGGNVTAIENKRASAGCPGALRGNIGSHGNFGGKNHLDDIPHGIHQAARGVHFNDHQAGTLRFGPANTPGDIVHGRGANGALNCKHQSGLGSLLLGKNLMGEGSQCQQGAGHHHQGPAPKPGRVL